MNIEEIREKILSDDSFVLSEIVKLQYLYGLKRVIRSHLSRECEDISESVAEHLYGMHVLVEYFKRIEPCVADLNYQKVTELIFAHDLGEIETGDIATNVKTDNDRKEEQKLFSNVLDSVPSIISDLIEKINKEYDSLASDEAKLVKAVDKLEPMLQYCDETHRQTFQDLKFSANDLERTKKKYIEPYPILLRFYEVIRDEYQNKNFFYIES